MANTLSLLVRQQLPEFIRSDYDTFATFIEAYYEFLDQSNNAIGAAKSLPTNLDIDTTTTAFMEYFITQYLPLFPPDRLSSPATMIAHAKEFYRAKGTPKAFKLLFRLLFGQNAEIFFPKDNILRASDGEWIREKSLRFNESIWTSQVGDGATTRFRALCDSRSISSGNAIRVWFGGTASNGISGSLQTTGYYHSPNDPYVVFSPAPPPNTVINISYHSPDIVERFGTNEIVLKLAGVSSNATAISETAEIIYDAQADSMDMVVSHAVGTFLQGETIHGQWTYDTSTGATLDVYGELFSSVLSIEVVKPGYGYNVGDPVIITGGSPTVAATAVVDEVLKAVVTNVSVLNGGAGYQALQPVYIISTPNTGLTLFVNTVDTSGNVHPNSYPVSQDTINCWRGILISNADYKMPPAGAETTTTRFKDALTFVTFGSLGPVTNIAIVSSTTVFSSTPQLKIDSPILAVTGSSDTNTTPGNVSIGSFGILGRMAVSNGGAGYVPGDEISFVNNVGRGIGIGGAAEVIEVHAANSGIKTVKFQPSRVTGTASVNVFANTLQVNGTSTFFTTELFVGDRVEINNETSFVASIVDSTHITVNTAFTKNTTSRYLGGYGRYFVGGINYSMSALPTVQVISSNGSATGANIQVTAVISGGESLLATGVTKTPGAIVAIRVVNPGYGYRTVPTINLTGKGNHLATAVAIVIAGLLTSSGHYKSTRGFLSADQHLQGAQYYYNNYSYVMRAQTELGKYSSIFKDLIHPSGTRLWGEYVIESDLVSTAGSANVANTYQTTA